MSFHSSFPVPLSLLDKRWIFCEKIKMRLATGWVSLEADSEMDTEHIRFISKCLWCQLLWKGGAGNRTGQREKSLCHTGLNTASENSGALFWVGPRWPGLYNLIPISAWMLATWARWLFAAEAPPWANGTPSCWGSKPVTEDSLAWYTNVSYYDTQTKNGW